MMTKKKVTNSNYMGVEDLDVYKKLNMLPETKWPWQS